MRALADGRHVLHKVDSARYMACALPRGLAYSTSRLRPRRLAVYDEGHTDGLPGLIVCTRGRLVKANCF